MNYTVIEKVGEEKSGTMSEVFDGYERQFCELSTNISRQCTTASGLDGGNGFSLFGVIGFEIRVIMKKNENLVLHCKTDKQI